VITGPTRSGKSRLAERLASESGREVVYAATSRLDPDDPEWVARVAEHRARRPRDWQQVETATGKPDLTGLLRGAGRGQLILIESVGTWLASFCEPPSDGAEPDGVALEALLRERSRELVGAIEATQAQVLAVCEQTGWGLIPLHLSGRVFSSVLGRLTTALARRAQVAYLAVAGYALDLRSAGALIDTEENL
jgi:adenosylcobinamide kinase/adenosylcobinamide-phosphate guanylyltransferase